jgi:hypothetical protein
MALRNCDFSDDEDYEDCNGNSICSGPDNGANTHEGKELVQPDSCSEDDDNLFQDDDTRALE